MENTIENNMKKIEFEKPQDMLNWLIYNEGDKLFDSYGREWVYMEYQFYFKDINETFSKPGLKCLHLFATELFHK